MVIMNDYFLFGGESYVDFGLWFEIMGIVIVI